MNSIFTFSNLLLRNIPAVNNSLTEENYLKTLLHLEKEAGEVSVNALSRSLDIKMPTVTSMMKKLAEKKLVHYQKYKPLRLTERGKKEAGLIIRKHRLTEMFLVEKMGFGWEEVHDIAEQIEHIKSKNFFDKMDELLGFPTLDPHGSPIPDSHGNLAMKSYRKLSDCKPGETVELTAILNTTSEFLKFLNSRKMKLGCLIKILAIEEFDKTMTVSYDKHTKDVLSEIVCERLLVNA